MAKVNVTMTPAVRAIFSALGKKGAKARQQNSTPAERKEWTAAATKARLKKKRSQSPASIRMRAWRRKQKLASNNSLATVRPTDHRRKKENRNEKLAD